jgi:PAS domain-containing protein
MTALEMDPNCNLNPWEAQALAHHYPTVGDVVSRGPARPGSDPLIWPDLYSRTGLDIMTILALIATRPNPVVDLGPVDCGVSLVVCERRHPDAPVVYVSEGFTELTGYPEAEVLGRDCRFLQSPPAEMASQSSSSSSSSSRSRRHASQRPDKDTIQTLRRAVEHSDEVQVPTINYRKDGTAFTNLVTIVPVVFNDTEYLVGFHAAV